MCERHHHHHQTTKLDQDLYDAAEYGDIPKMRCALEKGANINYTSCTKNGDTISWSVLMVSCKYNHYDAVAWLIDHKANILQMNDTGESALYWAYLFSYSHIIRLLLDSGADNDGAWLQMAIDMADDTNPYYDSDDNTIYYDTDNESGTEEMTSYALVRMAVEADTRIAAYLIEKQGEFFSNMQMPNVLTKLISEYVSNRMIKYVT